MKKTRSAKTAKSSKRTANGSVVDDTRRTNRLAFGNPDRSQPASPAFPRGCLATDGYCDAKHRLNKKKSNNIKLKCKTGALKTRLSERVPASTSIQSGERQKSAFYWIWWQKYGKLFEYIIDFMPFAYCKSFVILFWVCWLPFFLSLSLPRHFWSHHFLSAAPSLIPPLFDFQFDLCHISKCVECFVIWRYGGKSDFSDEYVPGSSVIA